MAVCQAVIFTFTEVCFKDVSNYTELFLLSSLFRLSKDEDIFAQSLISLLIIDNKFQLYRPFNTRLLLINLSSHLKVTYSFTLRHRLKSIMSGNSNH